MRESITPWLAAPMFSLALVVGAAMNVPGKVCEESFDPDLGAQHFLIVATLFVSIALGVVAANRWAAHRRRRGLSTVPLLEVWALLLGLGLAALVLFGDETAGPYGVLAGIGSILAVIGFFQVLGEEREEVALRNAGPWLPIYLATSAAFLYPAIALFTLHNAAHPFCGFG